MADDSNILRVGAEFDVSQIVAGAQEAGAAVEGLGAKVATVGVQAESAAAGTTEFATAEASAAAPATSLSGAIDALTASINRMNAARANASSGFQTFRGAMGEARVEMGALEGSTGMMAGGLARVVAQSQLLAPLISAAFVPFAAIAFVSILEQVVDEFGKASDAVAGYTEEVKKAEKADVEFSNKALESAHSVADAQAKLNEANREIAGAASEGYLQKLATAEQDHASKLLALIGPIGEAINAYEVLGHAEGDAADAGARFTEVARQQIINLEEQAVDVRKEAAAIARDQSEAAQAGTLSETQRIRDQISALNDQEVAEVAVARAEANIRLQKGESGPDAAAAAANVEAEYAAKRLELQNRLAVEGFKITVDGEKAKAEAIKSIGDATIAYEEAQTKRWFQEHQISLAEETSALETEENRRIQILRDSFDAQQAILAQRGKAGENVAPEETALAAARETAEIQHSQRMEDIDEGAKAEQFRIDQSWALKEIELNHEVAAAQDDLAQHEADRAFSKAQSPAAIASTGAEVIAAQTKAINDQVAALQQENEVLNQGPKDQKGGLLDPAAAQQVETNLTKIAVLQINLKNTTDQTNEEITTRTNEFLRQQMQDEISAGEEKIRTAEEVERRTVEIANSEFEARAINERKYLEEVQAAAQQEYETVTAEIANEADMVRAAANQRVITVAEETKQLEALWKRQEQAYQEMLNETTRAQATASKKQKEDIKRLAQEWSQDWVRMANEVLQGREKIGTALTKMAGDMEIQLIDKGINLVLTKTTEKLLELLVAHSTFIAKLLGIESAGDAAKIAKGAATSTALVMQQAAVAGAGAFASVAVTVPWPPNPGPALAAMGAAIGITESNLGLAAAEKGAIIPEDMPIYAHAKEMVLPAPISAAVQGAVPAIGKFNEAIAGGLTENIHNVVTNASTSNTKNESRSVRRGPTNIVFNGGTGGMSREDIVKTVRQAMRSGELRPA
jgi:hypothetical protein